MSQGEPEAYSIKFSGKVLDRVFWLYVIDVRSPQGRHLYVGGSGYSVLGSHSTRCEPDTARLNTILQLVMERLA